MAIRRALIRMFAQAAGLVDLTGPEPYALSPDYGTHLRDATALALAAEAGSQVVEAGRLTTDIMKASPGPRKRAVRVRKDRSGPCWRPARCRKRPRPPR